MDTKKLLRESNFFKGISEESLNSLASICIPRKYKKREILFLEGQKGNNIYLLAEGNIQLYKNSPEGKEIVIKVLWPGEIFAEVILFEEEHYPVSAVTLKESLVLAITKQHFYSLLSEESFRNDFIGILMKKQRYLANRIYYLNVHAVGERFFRFLLEQYGKRDEYNVPLNKKDIAAAIGTTPETLSRLLLRLKKEGKITWKGNLLKVKREVWSTG